MKCGILASEFMALCFCSREGSVSVSKDMIEASYHSTVREERQTLITVSSTLMLATALRDALQQGQVLWARGTDRATE